MKSEMIEIGINQIIIRNRLREDPGDLASLERSIQRFGLLHPITVDRDHVLISGGRRLEACRRAGLATVRAVRVDTTFDSMTSLDIIADENLCRQILNGSELERLIQMKKSALTGKTAGTGAFAKLKKVFSKA